MGDNLHGLEDIRVVSLIGLNKFRVASSNEIGPIVGSVKDYALGNSTVIIVAFHNGDRTGVAPQRIGTNLAELDPLVVMNGCALSVFYMIQMIFVKFNMVIVDFFYSCLVVFLGSVEGLFDTGGRHNGATKGICVG